MSLKKFMHPRNIYRTEPDFKSLAVLDPDFRQIAITELNGKVRIDFKDIKSLITLTKTLLKHDFKLDVEIPPIKLVPALPLRLNYILWIEDLLNFGRFSMEDVHGIDIGVGAICIYPLLIAQQNKWKMTGSEIDPVSFQFCMENVKRNKLEHLIKVKLVNPDTILTEILTEKDNFTFVMCNPPFFKTDDLTRNRKNPPRNAATGCERELIVEGGEQKFISRLIDDSLVYKDQVKIYTTMFGRKNTLGFVKRELAKRNITNATWTEFCQGYTKRWGLAWTFLPEETINLSKAPVIRTKTEVSRKNKDSSCSITFPETNQLNSLYELHNLFKNIVTELNVETKLLDFDDEYCECYAYVLTAYEDSWSHARRKRRIAMRNEVDVKKKCSDDQSSSHHTSDLSQELATEQMSDSTKEAQEKTIYLKCNILLQEIEGNDEEGEEETKDQLRVCFIFEEGSGGKQALETLRQYFINKLNVREMVSKANPDRKKKKKKKKKKSNEVDESSVIKI